MGKLALELEMRFPDQSVVFRGYEASNGVVLTVPHLPVHYTFFVSGDRMRLHETREDAPRDERYRNLFSFSIERMERRAFWDAMEERAWWLIRRKIRTVPQLASQGIDVLSWMPELLDDTRFLVHEKKFSIDWSTVIPQLWDLTAPWELDPGTGFLAASHTGGIAGLVLTLRDVPSDDRVRFVPLDEMLKTVGWFMREAQEPGEVSAPDIWLPSRR